jgi:hypothetical protein
MRPGLGAGKTVSRNSTVYEKRADRPPRFPVLAALACAAALAFTRVFPFATVVTGFAAPLAFTGILSLAGMCTFVSHGLERDSGLSGCAGCIGADRKGPSHEAGNRGARDECFRWFHSLFGFLVFKLSSSGSKPSRGSSRLEVLSVGETWRPSPISAPIVNGKIQIGIRGRDNSKPGGNTGWSDSTAADRIARVDNTHDCSNHADSTRSDDACVCIRLLAPVLPKKRTLKRPRQLPKGMISLSYR